LNINDIFPIRSKYQKAMYDYFSSRYTGIDVERDEQENGKPVMHYTVFKEKQIKLADLVTYDDNKQVIPLSERFNENNIDIRY